MAVKRRRLCGLNTTAEGNSGGENSGGKPASGTPEVPTALEVLLKDLGPVCSKAQSELPEGATVDEIAAHAVKTNVFHTMEKLLSYSPALRGMVKSGDVHIQFRSSDRYSLMHGLAIGGPFLQNHTLVFDSDGAVAWDGKLVAKDASASFENELVSLRGFTAEKVFRNRRRMWGIEMELSDRVSVTVTFGGPWRGMSFLDVFVTMPSPPGGTDGYCGDADGDVSDETKQRFWAREDLRVPSEESLFGHAASPGLLLAAESGERSLARDVDDEDDNNDDVLDEADPDWASGTPQTALDKCAEEMPDAAQDWQLACIVDVCSLGEEMLDHIVAVTQTAQATVARAQAQAAAANQDDEAPAVCHTCEKPEHCFNDVWWAMKVGIKEGEYDDKDWTPKITEESCFEEVQSALYHWQSLDDFELGGMKDRALPKPCESSSQPYEKDGLTYCR